MKVKKIIMFGMVAILSLGVLAGCSKPIEEKELVTSQSSVETKKSGENKQASDGPVAQSLIVNGSTSVQPLAEELAQKFKETRSYATIDIQGGGSGTGIKSAIDGVVDIGMSSRGLKEEEKLLKEYVIATDGIGVIVNPENGVEDLTSEQIKKIYMGEIKDWAELGGKTGKITVVTREEGSGTRGAFIELTGLEVKEGDSKVDKTTANAITQGSTGAVITTVSSDPNAIGYASFGSVQGKTEVKMIKIDGEECTEENINNGSYKISRPFLMLTKDEPTGLTKEFIDFMLSAEGQELVALKGYVKTVR
ncbi:MAG: phosphate ABC transporter substrate-binding protein [Epulopiscium sp.]|nr:phosphate ABC transporter substrate-binding protein [Candidatus Epulonipiscium sp.]